ncbi:MAG TPA: hypothetical protein VN706_05710 [Gemmatimonadaceae bacterium]|nr:hypothetical protein [Gemmatimonadaceae bacterium]
MHRLSFIVVLFAAAGLVACAAKDSSRIDTTKVAQSGAPAAAASRGSFDPATHVATVYAHDFAFEAPSSISAGWTTFHLVNDGPNLHHVQLVRLDSGKTANDLAAAMKNPGPPPMWAAFVGGPNAPNPHGESSLTMNLAPGNYVLLCLVDLPDHVPHFAKGMFQPLTVTPAVGTPMAEPTADMTVTLYDYNFDVTGTLTPGKHTIKIVNRGPQPHEIEMARPAAGKSAKDVLAWIAKPAGPPPGDAIGGTSAIVPGSAVYYTVDVTPGDYALLCLIPDGKDGKMHAEHGMVKDIVVK